MTSSEVGASSEKKTRGQLASSVHSFLRDFAAYAGAKGIAAAALVAGGALLESLGLVLLVPLLSVVFGAGVNSHGLQHRIDALFHLAGATTPLARLTLLLSLFACLMIARAVVVSRRSVVLAELQIGFVEAQRLRVTERLAAARWEQVVRLRHARITHLMSGDIQRVGVAANFLLQGLTALTMLVAQCVLAIALSPLLAGLAIALLIVGAIALVPVLRRARALGSYVTAANLDLLDGTAQFLGGLKLAISQDLQSRFVEEFRTTLKALTRRQIEYTKQQNLGQSALTALSALVAAVLVLVGFVVFHAAPAVLTTLLVIIARMSAPAGQLQVGAQQVAHALPAYEKIKELDAELRSEGSVNASGGADERLPSGAIVFDNVSFVHQDGEVGREGKGGVSGLTFAIASEEFLGIAGASGAGKTTFADLLVGLYRPQSGAISVGSQALDEHLLARWRASLSYVSQDPFLFHDSLRRNLTWASPSASDEELWQALRLTGAESLVRRMEKGLDTIVGERGTLVSGGERQRIALARAILRKPKLLVLDEATSAIDVASERTIMENLLALNPRPTIVMIAHRTESLSLCDRTLWLDGGVLQTLPSQKD